MSKTYFLCLLVIAILLFVITPLKAQQKESKTEKKTVNKSTDVQSETSGLRAGIGGLLDNSDENVATGARGRKSYQIGQVTKEGK